MKNGRLLLLVGCVLLWLTGAPSQARGKLEGTVTDYLTGKPITGVSVSIKAIGKGTITDERGRFSFDLPFGDYLLAFSAVGYRTQNTPVRLVDDANLAIELVEEAKQLDEVIITGKTLDHNVKEVQMSALQLDMRSIRRIPVVFGEVDIVKALTLQPGVATAGEGAGGFNVRGGRVDQNLVLLDGAPLFNTSHLLGFFTSVNPDVIADVTLYKGGFPAAYGGRLSALLTMNTKTGNEEKVRLSGGVSPISSRFLAEGPLLRTKKLTFLVGGRAAYPNYLIRQFPERFEGSRAAFYDLNAKLTYKINDKNQVSVAGYRSFDRFRFPEDTLYGWRSNVASLRWNRVLAPNLLLTLRALHSDYAFDIEGLQEGYGYRLTSSIRHRELRADLLYTSGRHRLEAGANAIGYVLSPGERRPAGEASVVNPMILAREYAREMAAYASEEFVVSPVLTVGVGLRYSWFRNVGPRTVYAYQEGVPRDSTTIAGATDYAKGQVTQAYGGWEPRVSLRLGLGENNAVKLSYNRMRQYIHLISNTTAISPVDFWKASDPFVPPQVADQWAVGFFRNYRDHAIETSVEAFYKDITDLVEYQNGATLLMNPTLEADLLRAKGRAYGAELSIQKNKGDLTGQVSYTYSRSLVAVRTTFPEEQVNEGESYPSNYDKPHNLALSAQYALGKGWTFAGNFVYSTGRPATYPDGQYVYNGALVSSYARRNADRIPDTHRLDVSFSRDSRRSKEQQRYSTLVFSLYNLYARKNPYSIYFTRSTTTTKSYRLSVLGTVIPSLTLNVYF
ncbi:MAG: TonB-dependent receptor [Ferruginibacter sp.]|nr:TonB-dependent receptor [Cytophagales bacterium]